MKSSKQVYTTYIRSTPKKTWDAITKPEFTREYWGGMANVSDWKKGARWEHLPKDDNDPWIVGKVVESTPPKRLVLTWADPEKLKDESRLTFEIEAMEDTICLIVTHDNFKTGSTMAGKVARGWPLVLSSLKSFLETGKGLDAFCKS
jgi:uncharacterized protein YndB with AHSA1/START domain